MKCIYRKKTINNYRGSEDNPLLCEAEEYFMTCEERQCPAYDPMTNKCRKLEKEMKENSTW